MLFAFALGCGRPAYRLDGRVPGGIAAVGLLDSTAATVVDSLYSAHARSLKELQRSTEAALDSLEGRVASLERPLADARARYRAALRRYRGAFGEMARFRSFGGNPIFTVADAGVGTSRLLEEIADRFYRGKAFSLETEGEIRRFIRRRLVPLERKVAQARSKVVRLERARSGGTEARERVRAEFQKRRRALLERYNRAILERLQERILLNATVDSMQYYLFSRLPRGRYHLYVPDASPDAWLVPVTLQQHTRQDLGAANRRRLLLVGDG